MRLAEKWLSSWNDPLDDGIMIAAAPSVLVFDVNETLIDIDSIAPLFERIFGDERAMREWFGQLVTYSMTATFSDNYVDFFTLGQAVLRMLAAVYGIDVTERDGQSAQARHADHAGSP